MRTPNSERFQGNMRLPEIYDPSPHRTRQKGERARGRERGQVSPFHLQLMFQVWAGRAARLAARAPDGCSSGLSSSGIFHLLLSVCRQDVWATSSRPGYRGFSHMQFSPAPERPVAWDAGSRASSKGWRGEECARA